MDEVNIDINPNKLYQSSLIQNINDSRSLDTDKSSLNSVVKDDVKIKYKTLTNKTEHTKKYEVYSPGYQTYSHKYQTYSHKQDETFISPILVPESGSIFLRKNKSAKEVHDMKLNQFNFNITI